MARTTGFGSLQKTLKELQKAMADLDGEVAEVRFDPFDPQSIELAIQKSEAAIDDKISSYQGNEMVKNIAAQLKESYREAILQKAEYARTENRNEQ